MSLSDDRATQRDAGWVSWTKTNWEQLPPTDRTGPSSAAQRLTPAGRLNSRRLDAFGYGSVPFMG